MHFRYARNLYDPKIKIIFDIENWLWKSEIRIFQSPPAKRTLICQKIFLWKSAIFNSIKLPFDVEVAEKILNGIYWSEVTPGLLTIQMQIQAVWSMNWKPTKRAELLLVNRSRFSLIKNWGNVFITKKGGPDHINIKGDLARANFVRLK